MRFILIALFIIAVCLSSAFSQTVQQNEPQRFSYHLWGTVLDEQSQPMAKISVCFVPAERPINGRIFCTKTDNDGNFAFTVKDIPDKYFVTASTGDSPFLSEEDKDKGYRFKSTEAIEFGAKDECRKIILQFDPIS